MGQQPTPQPSDLDLVSKIPKILPHERVFPIQIGSELFKLSGASLSSDGTDTLFHVPPMQQTCICFYWPSPSHHP